MSPGPCYYRGDLIVAPTPWNLDQDWENPFSFRAGIEEVLKAESQLIPFHTSPAPLLLLSGLEDSDAKGETREYSCNCDDISFFQPCQLQ